MSENTMNNQGEQELDLNDILRARQEKLAELIEEGRNPFEKVKYDVTHSTEQIKEDFNEFEGKPVSIAGRLMSKRVMGKASFGNIQDRDSNIQIYVQINELGESDYSAFKKLDIGDILGVKGTVFLTKRGEISIKVSEFVLLTKSMQPLPEKFHGLKDTDTRYRQRYIDLIVNPEVKKNFIIRSKIIKAMREYLDEKGFLEVETPLLNTKQGGATARPFVTHHNTLDLDLYMRIAPELYLKRLIVGGLEKVYEIGKNFRNEGMSVKHNPEFTMLELYSAYTDFHGMMALAENMVYTIANQVLGTAKIQYQGIDIDLTPPWSKMTMIEAVKKYTGVDFNEINNDDEANAVAKQKGINLEKKTSKGEILSLIFEECVEEHLKQPTFIYDYPVEISPLAKRKPDDHEMTERFEIFSVIGEMGNAFSELNDPIDQKGRFMDQVKKREAGDEEAGEMDEDFINALEIGLPPTGGMGIGVDRLIMLLTDSSTIRDVILFPTMKPKA